MRETQAHRTRSHAFTGVDVVAAHQAAIAQHLEFALTILAAVAILGERPGRSGLAGLSLIGVGLLLLSTLRAEAANLSTAWSWAGLLLLSVDHHGHRHSHEEGGRRVEHSHPHVHDEHHRHRHGSLL